MKKFLLLLIAALALTGVLGASQITVNCPTIIYTTPVGTNSVTCAGFGLVFTSGPLVLDKIVATYTGDYTFNTSDPGTPTATYNWNAPGTALDVNNFGPFTPRPQSTSVTLLGAAARAAYDGFLQNNFTMIGSGTATGPVTAFTQDASFTIDYHDTTVPEPASMAMLGGGLVLLGTVVRRFRKA